MHIYQISMTCSGCGRSSRSMVAEQKVAVKCSHCETELYKASRLNGVIYVMSSPKVEGVKIGMTTNDVFKRAKQLSGTGVPLPFEVRAVFPSHRPPNDEKKVHDKLKSSRIDKEHFDLDEVVAVAKVKSVLQRDPVFVHPDLRDEYEALVERRKVETLTKLGKLPISTN